MPHIWQNTEMEWYKKKIDQGTYRIKAFKQENDDIDEQLEYYNTILMETQIKIKELENRRTNNNAIAETIQRNISRWINRIKTQQNNQEKLVKPM